MKLPFLRRGPVLRAHLLFRHHDVQAAHETHDSALWRKHDQHHLLSADHDHEPKKELVGLRAFWKDEA